MSRVSIRHPRSVVPIPSFVRAVAHSERVRATPTPPYVSGPHNLGNQPNAPLPLLPPPARRHHPPPSGRANPDWRLCNGVEERSFFRRRLWPTSVCPGPRGGGWEAGGAEVEDPKDPNIGVSPLLFQLNQMRHGKSDISEPGSSTQPHLTGDTRHIFLQFHP